MYISAYVCVGLYLESQTYLWDDTGRVHLPLVAKLLDHHDSTHYANVAELAIWMRELFTNDGPHLILSTDKYHISQLGYHTHRDCDTQRQYNYRVCTHVCTDCDGRQMEMMEDKWQKIEDQWQMMKNGWQMLEDGWLANNGRRIGE